LDDGESAVELPARVVASLGSGDARAACEALATAEGRLQYQDDDSLGGELLLPDPSAMALLLANGASQPGGIAAYNEWIAKLADGSTGRIVGVAQIPTTNLADATAELQHAIDLGLRAVALNSLPGETSEARFPDESRTWWQLAGDNKITVTLPADFRLGYLPVRGVVTGGRAPDISFVINEIPISGILDDNPELRFLIASGEPGWLPAALDHADNLYMRSVATRPRSLRDDTLNPSDYIRRACWFVFHNDDFAVANRAYIGEYHLTWAALGPSLSDDWPNDLQKLARSMGELSPSERQRLLSANLLRLLHLGAKDFTPEEIRDFRNVVLV